MTKMYTFKTFYHQIKLQKNDFFRVNIYGILATLCLVPLPMLMPLLIDEVLLEHKGRLTTFLSATFSRDETWIYLSTITLFAIVLRLAVYIFSNRQTLHATRITQNIAYLMRKRILHHLERVSLKEYETLKSGGVASKTIQDVETLSAFVGQVVSNGISAVFMLFSIIIIMFWMHWTLTLIVLILNPIFLGLAKIIGRKTSAYLKQKNEMYQRYNEMLHETLELFMQVRVSNQEHLFFGLLQDRAKDVQRVSTQYVYKAYKANNASVFMISTAIDIFRIIAIAGVAYSNLSIGMMIAFLFYLSALVQPMQQLMGLVVGYQSVKPAMERMNQLLGIAQEIEYQPKINPFDGVTSTSLTLKNIDFSYTEGKKVLDAISLHANVGKKIALIGESGSGKTTIAQVLVGLYPPTHGEVCYDDVALENIGLPVVRENVALMLQESLFFNDTIRMNICLHQDVSESEIQDALKMAHIEEFVQGLDDGLDTYIGKNAIRLSGGQKQRLAIARLILSNPKIVILDESTSALDTETEYQLYQSMAPFLEHRTTIIIAHRATTIKFADYIYVIEKGKVKAEGTYEELEKLNLIKENFDAT